MGPKREGGKGEKGRGKKMKWDGYIFVNYDVSDLS
jgi:hypothetical protein